MRRRNIRSEGIKVVFAGNGGVGKTTLLLTIQANGVLPSDLSMKGSENGYRDREERKPKGKREDVSGAK